MQRLSAFQKSNKGAPAYSRLINRRLGRHGAAVAHALERTPNQVTAASALCTFAGIYLVALVRPSIPVAVAITAALVVGYALDSADGQLARLRGGGTLAGEWLDHVVDAVKTVALHAAVLVSVFRFRDHDGAVLLLPLGYLCVASAWFFTVILTDQLRRATRSSAPSPGPAPMLRSILALPSDYGVLCLVFLLLAAGDLFLWAYGAMFLGSTLIFAAALRSWFRELSTLDHTSISA